MVRRHNDSDVLGGSPVPGVGARLFSRKVVGWCLADHMRLELVAAALEMAVARRRPERGAIHHSDHGSQYTAVLFGEQCAAVGIDVSMGSIGDCFDNAVCESFHSTLKRELVNRHSWPTRAALRTAVFEYLETFYNTRRRHSTLAYLSPADYEAAHTLTDCTLSSTELDVTHA